MAIDRANALCGAIFIAFGAYFALNALSLDLGTAFRMGPGFFPLALAAVLILMGAVIFVQALRVHGEAVGPIAWRGMLLILPAPVFFGLTIRGLGFVPALFVTAFIACFASMRMSLLWALLLAAAVTGFSTLVFIEGLGLPFMLFGPWLGGR